MNEKVKAKYLRRARKFLETKLIGVFSSEVLYSIHRLELCRIDIAKSKNFKVDDNA